MLVLKICQVLTYTVPGGWLLRLQIMHLHNMNSTVKT